MTVVLVTGASGYMASHIVLQLLEKGYEVRGTVRNPNDKQKCGHLQSWVAEGKKLQLVKADLLSESDWFSVMKGVELVIHTASPFIVGVSEKDADEKLIKPAVGGTLNVLRAASNSGVKRVVITSSTGAVHEGRPDLEERKLGKDKFVTEKDWSVPELCDPYFRSKTLAERAAWDFYKSQSGKGLEIVVICPGFMLGPTLSHNNDSTSIGLYEKLIMNGMPMVPHVNFGSVDVRDVAEAHFKALVTTEANGERFLAVSENLWIQEWAVIVSNEFKPKGYKVPTMTMPTLIHWGASFVEPELVTLRPKIGQVFNFDSSKAVKMLGVNFRPVKQSIIEMGHSLIATGIVPKKFQ